MAKRLTEDRIDELDKIITCFSSWYQLEICGMDAVL